MLRIISLFLFIFTAYLSWWAMTYEKWVWIIPALVCLITGVGLTLRWRWAAYLWILLAGTISIWWVYITINIAISGWPSVTLMETIISLIPGGILILICITSSVSIYKKLKNKSYLRG